MSSCAGAAGRGLCTGWWKFNAAVSSPALRPAPMPRAALRCARTFSGRTTLTSSISRNVWTGRWYSYAVTRTGMRRLSFEPPRGGSHCQSNPVDVVPHLLAQQPGRAVRTQHHPAMPWRDIPAFVQQHLRPGNRPEVVRSLLEFVILTACRSGEARGMTWSDVDFKDKVWTIPSDRMKAKVSHRVPLSPRAMVILELQKGQHETLVFPSIRDRVELSDMAITSILRRLKVHSDTPGRVATTHGFRSSSRDWCGENGYPRDLAERSLAHTCWRRLKSDQACRLNFDQGPAPGFVRP